MHSTTRFSAPPRRVPMSLVIANLFNGMSQIGFFVFGFGMVFAWTFGAMADLSVLHFGTLTSARGQITQVEQTGASENEQPVYANYYAFSLAGQRQTGVSYSTGEAGTVGAEVEVEYDESDPTWSRIAGMRRGHFGPLVLFVLIFPAIGLAFVFFALRSGWRRSRLLRNGEFTMGRLVGKEPTNVTVNKRRVYELTFEFISRDGQRREAKARTTDTQRLEDEAQEPLLYDPDNPSVAYVLDELPQRPSIDGTGELEGRFGAAIGLIIIPGIVIGANVLAALWKMGLL